MQPGSIPSQLGGDENHLLSTPDKRAVHLSSPWVRGPEKEVFRCEVTRFRIVAKSKPIILLFPKWLLYIKFSLEVAACK